MCLQAAIQFEECFRCYVVGQENVCVMRYDPKRPHHLRYVQSEQPVTRSLHDRMVNDALTVCRTLGYDLNADADLHSVGEAHFEWIVENVAQMAIDKALAPERKPAALHWDCFLKNKAVGS